MKWGPIVLAEIRKLQGFTDVNSDQQNAGLQASLTYDRQTAARLGISAQLIDDTLYDAFGQRQVSTIFTSLNQYHVVMEVDPHFWQNPKGLDAIYLRPTNGSNVTPSAAEASSQSTPAPMALATSSSTSANSQPTPAPIAAATPSSVGATSPADSCTDGRCYTVERRRHFPADSCTGGCYYGVEPGGRLPADSCTDGRCYGVECSGEFPVNCCSDRRRAVEGSCQLPIDDGADRRKSPGPVPISDNFFQSRPTHGAERRGERDSTDAAAHRDAEHSARKFFGDGPGVPSFLSQRAIPHPRGAGGRLHCLGILYESYIHPVTILSTLPSAGVGALLALMLFRPNSA